MEMNLAEVLIAGAAGGFSLAVAQLLVAYRKIVHSDDPQIKMFLFAQIIPLLGLTTLGAIVAWVTATGPISPFLSGLTGLGFVLLLTQTSHEKEEVPHG